MSRHSGDAAWASRSRVVKLRDYQDHWATLEASDNPFATGVMAHLQIHATRRDPERRLQGKLYPVRRLYERGYTRQDILELFRFIDWVLALPAGLETRFQAELMQLEAQQRMQYVTSIERMGIEKGIQQGEVLVLRRLLARRFGALPDWVEERLTQANRQELEAWADRVLDALQLEEVFQAPRKTRARRAPRPPQP
jgi:hypothetical protein